MSIDLYTPRTMIAALRKILPVQQFFRSRFFASEASYRTEYIDIDITDSRGRPVAPFVRREGRAIMMTREGFTTRSAIPPTIKIGFPITSDDVERRLPGETVYQDIGPEARGEQLLAQDLVRLREMKDRRIELMCRDAVLNVVGNATRVVASGKDDDGNTFTDTYDFPRDSELVMSTLAGSDEWTHADSDPIAYLEDLSRTFAEVTGKVAVDVIFGATAYRTFLGNTKVKEALDAELLIRQGEVVIQGAPRGLRKFGRLLNHLDLWTYDEFYNDPDTGVRTPMMPPKKILMSPAAEDQRTELRFGALRTMTMPANPDDAMPTLFVGPEMPVSYADKPSLSRIVELHTRPLPIPIENDHIVVQVQA